MDFKNANELLTLCEEQNISISEVMRNREIITGECPAKEVDQKMMAIMAMGIKKGMEVEVTVEGENEEAAAAKMEEFFKANL